MSVDIQSCFVNVAWLRPSECERKAWACLNRLREHTQKEITLPIDIEHLVELVDELSVEYVKDDFFEHHPGEVLGMFDFKSNTVFLNEERNHVEVRLRWTLAHEYGHQVLHSPYFKAGQQSLFEPDPPSTLLYRAKTSAASKLERQANMFAESILMPRELLMPLIQPLRSAGSGQIDPDLAVNAVRLAAKVSRGSARIRLENLGEIPKS